MLENTMKGYHKHQMSTRKNTYSVIDDYEMGRLTHIDEEGMSNLIEAIGDSIRKDYIRASLIKRGVIKKTSNVYTEYPLHKTIEEGKTFFPLEWETIIQPRLEELTDQAEWAMSQGIRTRYNCTKNLTQEEREGFKKWKKSMEH